MRRHDPIDDLIGEIHELLKGINFRMAEGHVEFFNAGDSDDTLVVDIRGRPYEITVRDIGPGRGPRWRPR